MTATKHPGIVDLLFAYWWVILIFGGTVLGWLGEVFGVGASAVSRSLQVRHKRRLQLERARAKAARPAAQERRPLPGQCVHRRVRQVRDMDGNLVAWLCLKDGCEKQLPPDWAVAAEDLP